MKWVILAILIDTNQIRVEVNGPYANEMKCNKVIETYIEEYSKPEANFELVCVRTDQLT